MKATPFSEKPYIPFLLANGNDCMLMNHTGAMVCGASGHVHNDQIQGVVCGWHKASQKKNLRFLQPIIMAGYKITIDGEMCEPLNFEQQFSPVEATLDTLLTFRKNVSVRVSSFLSDSGVHSITVKVLHADEGMKVSFTLTPANYISGSYTFFLMPEIELEGVESGLDFTYAMKEHGSDEKFNAGVRGTGVMRTSLPGFVHEKECGMGLAYSDICDGWEATAYISCAEEDEKPVLDYQNLREEHLKIWKDYFATSSVTLPDEELQYITQLSRYLLKANLHPTGALPAGPLPYHWGGGTCCPFDSEIMQHAMLRSGNFDEAFRHVMFYVNQYEAGAKIVSELGLKGVAFSNWSDVFGNHRSRDLKYELTKRKPTMIAIIGSVGGNFNNITGKHSEEARKLLLGCAEFIESGFVRDGKIVSLMAGNESDVEVERDSWMLAVSYRCFRFAQQEDPDNPKWKQLVENMLIELRKNINKDGVLMPYQDAKYTAGTMPWAQYSVQNICSDKEAVINARKPMITPWGLDSDQPSEVERNWPWNHALFAKTFAEVKCPEEAFKHLKEFTRYASSNGAIPEYIRLDGFPIGYWYPTPYAVFLLALYSAFAFIDSNGTLCLLYGFDGQWKDMAISKLRLPNNVTVSITVKEGKVEKLDIDGSVNGLDINPCYA